MKRGLEGEGDREKQEKTRDWRNSGGEPYRLNGSRAITVISKAEAGVGSHSYPFNESPFHTAKRRLDKDSCSPTAPVNEPAVKKENRGGVKEGMRVSGIVGWCERDRARQRGREGGIGRSRTGQEGIIK